MNEKLDNVISGVKGDHINKSLFLIFTIDMVSFDKNKEIRFIPQTTATKFLHFFQHFVHRCIQKIKMINLNTPMVLSMFIIDTLTEFYVTKCYTNE